MYLALYGLKGLVIFDHPYDAEYALSVDGEFAAADWYRTASSGAVSLMCLGGEGTSPEARRAVVGAANRLDARMGWDQPRMVIASALTARWRVLRRVPRLLRGADTGVVFSSQNVPGPRVQERYPLVGRPVAVVSVGVSQIT